MIFHENRLLADDSNEISYLIFFENSERCCKFVVCCSRDWRFKVIKPLLSNLCQYLKASEYLNPDISSQTYAVSMTKKTKQSCTYASTIF